MNIEEIKSNWTKTDNIIYGDNAFDVKLKFLEAENNILKKFQFILLMNQQEKLF